MLLKLKDNKIMKLTNVIKEEMINFFTKKGAKVYFSEDEDKVAVIGLKEFENPFEGFYVEKLDDNIKLSSREFQNKNTIVNVDSIKIGEGFTIISGPCAVESKEQLIETAKGVKDAGAVILRGGAYKPRTSPYAFQGLEKEGLDYLKEARELLGMPIITEAIDVETFGLVEKYTDIIQIGARNMQNFPLLKKAGKSKKPVMLKRGMSAKIEELLMSAEYILSEGNRNVMLCERGIRTFENSTRNTLDLAGVALLKRMTHLPVFVDPSHGTGRKEIISKMSLAAKVIGADGVMIETHYKPCEALCDGEQSLDLDEFKDTVAKVNKLNEIEL